MMSTSYSVEQHHEVFEMDGFDFEEDYGEFVELDSDNDSVLRASPLSSSPLSDYEALTDDEECSAASVTVTGSRIRDSSPDSLAANPPILAPAVVDAIVEDGLPWSMQEATWDRLFSSSRDGASFGTFMRRVRGQGQTIIVAKTSDGRVVGGYATDVWSGRKARSDPRQAADAFLFTVDPPAAKAKHSAGPACHTFIPGLGELGTSPTGVLDFGLHSLMDKPHVDQPRVDIFKPSRADGGLKQACQLGSKRISLGDEDNGGMSLVIDASFSRGVACTRGEAEFDIIEFEVYGLSDD